MKKVGVSYIWGKSGQTWTQKDQDAATREMTVKYGSRWIGKRVADCSGLFVWAFKQFGETIYHGSDTIWREHCSTKGTLRPGQLIKPGTAVFLTKNGHRHHIGMFVGDDTVIEEKGTIYGAVVSHLNHWDEWGELKKVDYTNVIAETANVEPRTLQKGSEGADVEELQSALMQLNLFVGASGADGIFGSKTEAAVKTFQADHSLTVDGVVGEKTRAALKLALSNVQEDGTESSSGTKDEYILVLHGTKGLLQPIHDKLGGTLALVEAKNE